MADRKCVSKRKRQFVKVHYYKFMGVRGVCAAGNRRRKSPIKDGQVLQYNTIKVRLYPTPEQAELFEKTFGCCRYVWNQMLSDEQLFYNATGKHFIPTPAKYKNGAPFLREVDNQALIHR